MYRYFSSPIVRRLTSNILYRYMHSVHVYGEPRTIAAPVPSLPISVTSNTVYSPYTVSSGCNEILHTIHIIVNVINYIILYVKLFLNFTCTDHFQIKFFCTIIFNYSRKPYLKQTMLHNGILANISTPRNQFNFSILKSWILIGSSNIEAANRINVTLL